MTRSPFHRPLPAIVSRATAALVCLACFAPPAEAADEDGLWEWPTRTAVPVTRDFDPPARNWLPGHRGVDLAAPVGSTLYAPADGVVVYAGLLVDRSVLSIDHGDVSSTYEPVEPLVAVGQPVVKGQPIAVVEAGHSPGPAHWGAKTGASSYVDPLRMLVGRARLKEW